MGLAHIVRILRERGHRPYQGEKSEAVSMGGEEESDRGGEGLVRVVEEGS